MKLVKPRFGVVVHRTPTEEFDLETGATQAAEEIIEDNDLMKHGFRIEELAWMKSKDKTLGKFASLGIWFDSAEGAEHMLREGFLVSGNCIHHVERREIKKEILPMPTVWPSGMDVQGNATMRILCGPARTGALPTRSEGPMP
ncbi:hypothetical protein N7490_002068 [Penicillium lividum]|nr:hypothetical protein N7490_002068 [Penicillium lividum]